MTFWEQIQSSSEKIVNIRTTHIDLLLTCEDQSQRNLGSRWLQQFHITAWKWSLDWRFTNRQIQKTIVTSYRTVSRIYSGLNCRSNNFEGLGSSRKRQVFSNRQAVNTKQAIMLLKRAHNKADNRFDRTKQRMVNDRTQPTVRNGWTEITVR